MHLGIGLLGNIESNTKCICNLIIWFPSKSFHYYQAYLFRDLRNIWQQNYLLLIYHIFCNPVIIVNILQTSWIVVFYNHHQHEERYISKEWIDWIQCIIIGLLLNLIILYLDWWLIVSRYIIYVDLWNFTLLLLMVH